MRSISNFLYHTLLLCSAVMVMGTASCTSPDYGNSEQIIDSTQAVLADWKRELTAPRVVQVDSIYNLVKRETDSLLQQFTDTSDRYFWVDVISDYANVAKKAGDYEYYRGTLVSDLELTTHQLDDLKTDLLNEALTPIEIDSFLRVELRMVSELEQEVRLRLNQSEKIWQIYETKSPEIRRYLDQL